MVKLFFHFFIVAVLGNVYAEEKNPCTDELAVCSKKPEKEQVKCFTSLSDKCMEYSKKNSPASVCAEEISGECNGKKDQEMLKCLRKSKNKKCAAATAESKVTCPPNPCPVDYGKTDADKIFECHMKFNEKNPECLKPSAQPSAK